ncbi:MAG: hypothetical protein ABEJ61_00375 [Haloferacaceae archaeon]
MRRRRRLALVGLLAASLMLVTATSGFSSVEADRGMNAAVVSDANAFLGLEERVAGCGDHARFAVTNRLGTEIDVSATVVDASTNITADVTDAPTGLVPGDTDTIDVDVHPVGNTTTDGLVTLDIVATEEGTRVELTRTVRTDCLPRGDSGGGTDGGAGPGPGPDGPKDVSFVALCSADGERSGTYSVSGGPRTVSWSASETAAGVDAVVYKAGQSVYAIPDPDGTFASGDGTRVGTVGGGSSSALASDPCGATNATTELVKFEYENGLFEPSGDR